MFYANCQKASQFVAERRFDTLAQSQAYIADMARRGFYGHVSHLSRVVAEARP